VGHTSPDSGESAALIFQHRCPGTTRAVSERRPSH